VLVGLFFWLELACSNPTYLDAALLVPGAVAMPNKHKNLRLMLLWCFIWAEELVCKWRATSCQPPRPFQLLWAGCTYPESVFTVVIVTV